MKLADRVRDAVSSLMLGPHRYAVLQWADDDLEVWATGPRNRREIAYQIEDRLRARGISTMVLQGKINKRNTFYVKVLPERGDDCAVNSVDCASDQANDQPRVGRFDRGFVPILRIIARGEEAAGREEIISAFPENA